MNKVSAKVKICGITNFNDVKYVTEFKPDYIGMVLFFEKSKRNLDINHAKLLLKEVASDIKKCAVVVSPTVEQLKQIEDAGFDYIQIHGDLTQDVYDSSNIPIIRAVNIAVNEKISENNNILTDIDRSKISGVLFDAGKPGSGETFNWDFISGIKNEVKKRGKQLILAGGLNPLNVSKAVQMVLPDVVDVSSGVEFDETDKLGKDPEKIKEFIKNARQGE